MKKRERENRKREGVRDRREIGMRVERKHKE
jgi:hypothetical protein